MSDVFDGLDELCAVADKRSFTAAAAALRVTPSAISQRVRALEERVGVRLLQRTTRSVGLTEAGTRFLARVRPAMQGIHDAYAAVGELRDKPSGSLRLNLSRMAYELVVAPKLDAFMKKYPDIDLDVAIDDAFRDIVKDGFDAGIRLGEMVEREMVAVRVGPDLRMAVVGSPSYFASRPKPKRPRDLQSHECINYRRRKLGVVYRWEFEDNGKAIEVAVNGRLLVNDGDLMTKAALDGLGLAYVVEASVREHLAARRLVRVLEPFLPPFPGFFLYYPTREQLAPKLRAFSDFLKVKAR